MSESDRAAMIGALVRGRSNTVQVSEGKAVFNFEADGESWVVLRCNGVEHFMTPTTARALGDALSRASDEALRREAARRLIGNGAKP